jgi:hypothetical protein
VHSRAWSIPRGRSAGSYPHTALFILSNISLEKVHGGTVQADGGKRHVLDPWHIDDGADANRLPVPAPGPPGRQLVACRPIVSHSPGPRSARTKWQSATAGHAEHVLSVASATRPNCATIASVLPHSSRGAEADSACIDPRGPAHRHMQSTLRMTVVSGQFLVRRPINHRLVAEVVARGSRAQGWAAPGVSAACGSLARRSRREVPRT